MSAKRKLSVGVLDAAIASLATFLVGGYAVYLYRNDPVILEAYSIAFSGFILAGVIPAFAVYNPVEVVLLKHTPKRQLGALPRSLMLGAVPSLLASVLVAAVVAAISSAPSSITTAFVVTLVASSTLSPVQDHARRVMHGAGHSEWAFITSVVQFVGVLGLLVGLSVADVPKAWIPLGSLAGANALSLATAWVLAARGAEPPVGVDLAIGRVASLGGWVLLANLMERLGPFVALIIITSLVDGEPGANYEPARQLANPLYVLGNGLLPILRAPVVSAVMERNRAAAKRPIMLYLGLLLGAGGLWTLVAGIEWSFNPLPKLDMFKLAYDVNGLVAFMVLWMGLWTMSLIFANELMGGGHERALARANITATALGIVFAGLAAKPLGAMAIPLALTVQFLTLNALYLHEREAMYRSQPAPQPVEAVTGS